MSDSPQYEAFRNFASEHIGRRLLEVTEPLKEEIRSLRTQLEIRGADIERLQSEQRSAPVPVPITLPEPKNGKDGRGIDDLSIRDGSLVVRFTDKTEQNLGRIVGKDGDPGTPGKDATGIAEVAKRNGELVVRLTDNTERNLGRIDPEKGEPGQDGIGTREELEAIAKEINADLQVRNLADVWRGVWKVGETYKPGELAQWDGSPWIALRASKDVKPGTSAPDWNLFAKKGRDGR